MNNKASYKQASFLQQQKCIIPFFVVCLILCIVYRIFFFIESYATPFETFESFTELFAVGMGSDLLTCVILTAGLFAINTGLILFLKKPTYVYHFLAFLIFIFFAMLLLINIKLFSLLYMGLNYTILKSYLNDNSVLFKLTSFIDGFDVLIMLLAIIMYVGCHILSFRVISKVFYVLIIFYVLIYLNWLDSILKFNIFKQRSRIVATCSNPLNRIVTTFMKSYNPYNAEKFVIPNTQLNSMRLIDESFCHSNSILSLNPAQRAEKQKKLNIIFIVLESVGAKYVFNKRHDNRVAMPFLKWLSTKSAWFENHYSGGNISALGQFSIFTGIYPNPIATHFELQKTLNIPTLINWLSNDYDSFFVSTSNDVYFSMAINKTFREYVNAEKISPHKYNLYSNMFLDERIGFDFFLKRLKRATFPFVGVYWTGAAHSPYPDYLHHYETDDNKIEPKVRYLNNLYVLDQEIKQIYEYLEKNHLIDNTMLIVIGDHGELFGQHDNYFFHGSSLYQEEIKVPLLIYAPKLFKPITVRDVTSSVDILPTILEGLSIPYDKSKIQGESLFASNHARKYIFVYGDQDDIAAIDQNNIKMIISFSEATCRVYDLNKDPDEMHPLPCNFMGHQTAILKFRNFQPQLLARYVRR